ncbi:MAG TPA: SIMPL domain-containing protein [Allosphingosinicella sp.]|nr:SIMPL domain-containing protein [Allosphingosinicella sp.]
MRKIVVAAWLALSSVVAAVPAAADSPVSLPPLGPGEVLLEVSAAGTVHTPATNAAIDVELSGHGDDDAAARRMLDEQIRQVSAAARAAGVAAGDIRVGTVRTGGGEADILNDLASGTSTTTSGGRASTTVTICLRSLGGLERLRERLGLIEGVSVGEPAYSLDDDSVARRQARADAIRRARADADAYAATMNMRIVRVLRVTERGGFDFMSAMFGNENLLVRQMEGRMGGRGSSGSQIETVALIGVDFALAPR